ncbi:GNAT family N-acetyltransferase [Cohnella candidum]|uniref:N-acetyltransferase n=1 Tax=Cohnella candidum TaxID=2674991 RepID=A0A3G3JZX4_9BACL|nr:GNAT family N-acetyltransferase [Cohnella candidum]AYQ73800.1 N-acetyltransferase [Cohnella candidum]
MITVDAFVVSDDPAWLDLRGTYDYLQANMYWAAKLSYEDFVRSLAFSAVCLGVYQTDDANRRKQVGFARVVSDRATFAYLTDVFIHEDYRGLGLSKKLMEAVMSHPDLQSLRRFLLVTADAQGLYSRYGFRELGEEGSHWLQIFRG